MRDHIHVRWRVLDHSTISARVSNLSRKFSSLGSSTTSLAFSSKAAIFSVSDFLRGYTLSQSVSPFFRSFLLIKDDVNIASSRYARASLFRICSSMVNDIENLDIFWAKLSIFADTRNFFSWILRIITKEVARCHFFFT